MKNISYEFVDLDSEEAFKSLGQSLGGTHHNKALVFDNHIAKGQLVRSTPDNGLWIRKWKFTVFQKLTLHKVPPTEPQEKKLILIYFLDPSIFLLKNNRKNIKVSSPRNNMFLTSDIPMDFSVIPKQPFYVLDIAFTASWLSTQLADADPSFKNMLDSYLDTSSVLMEPCTKEEYQTLHELELSMDEDNEDVLFIRSRVYNLIISFFNKVVNRKDPALIKATVHYEQIMQAEMLVMESLEKPPKIDTIAKKVNLSVSSLIRQFKLIYGKSIYEYYVAKKMDIAKKMILENKITVRELASTLGYKQASPFIETFTKQHGCSPGTLKLESDRRLFF